MKWLKNMGEAVRTVRECLSEIGMARALRRAEVNMDRLLDRMIEKHPRLGFIDKVFPPIDAPLRLIRRTATREPELTGGLIKDGLDELPRSLLPKDTPKGGKEWLQRIALEAEQLKPPAR